MFQVGRFDPRAEEEDLRKKKRAKKNKKRKRKLSHDGDKAKPTSTLRVIAPEAKPHKQPPAKQRTDEALDDLDLLVADPIELDPIEDAKQQDELVTVNGDDDDDDREPDAVSKKESQSNEGERDRASRTTATNTKSQSPEIATALYMSSLPIRQAAEMWGLAPFLVDNLEKDGYESFFPIQSLVIPDVIASDHHSRILRVRDICVGAPTGSGKTLAFCLPVLNALAPRQRQQQHQQIRRLRALIILPSRDLARQVHQVFVHYSQGSNLRIGLTIGQSDFQNEQHQLLVGSEVNDDDSGGNGADSRYYQHVLNPYNLDLALKAFPAGQRDSRKPVVLPRGGQSAVDVLVATPGRLVDHLDKTPGFTLQHLRYLVIDEADRLVSQSYHSFVRRIMASVHDPSEDAWRRLHGTTATCDDGSAIRVDPITWRRRQQERPESDGPFGSIHDAVCQKVQLRRLLFSATLTKDPQKLAGLGLVNPKHFDAHHLKVGGGSATRQYSMPPSLAEYTVECTAEQKPLILLAVLLEQLQQQQPTNDEGTIVAVFTCSVDSTHRLVRLLQLLWDAAGIGDASQVVEFSSALSQSQRSSIMQRCQNNLVSVVVCSDGMSRGMDIASVGTVVNYDVPRFAKTYVHRCGRTARAGRSGKAVSLLKGGQVGQFRKMRNLVEEPSRIKSMRVHKELVRDAFSHYRDCVHRLKAIIEAEEAGDLDKTGPLPDR